jgi:hypothetical protein
MTLPRLKQLRCNEMDTLCDPEFCGRGFLRRRFRPMARLGSCDCRSGRGAVLGAAMAVLRAAVQNSAIHVCHCNLVEDTALSMAVSIMQHSGLRLAIESAGQKA